VGLLIRLGILVLRRPWGRIALGTLLVIGGIIYGTTSHQVSYQESKEQGKYEILVSQDNANEYYIHFEGSDTYYIVHGGDFSPHVNSDVFNKGGNLTALTYKSDSESIDAKKTDGTKLTGTGYNVELFGLADNNGQNERTFKNEEYIQHPGGFYDNRWPVGGAVAALGLLLIGLLFYLARKVRGTTAQSFTPVAPNTMNYAPPYQNPMEAGQYGQPQNPSLPGAYNQYGQPQPQNPSLPGAYNQYGQGQPYASRPDQAVPPTVYGQPPAYGQPQQPGMPNGYGQPQNVPPQYPATPGSYWPQQPTPGPSPQRPPNGETNPYV